MVQLVATFNNQPVRNHYSTDIETFNIAETLNMVSYEATAILDFHCHVPSQNPSS